MVTKDILTQEFFKISNDLPFDPRVVYSLLNDVEKNDLHLNYNTISNKLQACPAVLTHTFRAANQHARERDKRDRVIKTPEDAVQVIGLNKFKEILISQSLQEIMDHLLVKDSVRWNFYRILDISAGISAEELLNNFYPKSVENSHSIKAMASVSNIGRTFLSIWKKDEYYSKVEKYIEYDLPNTNRSQLEKDAFNNDHKKIGKMLLNYWNLEPKYSNACLIHENVKHLSSYEPEEQILILSNVMAKTALPIHEHTEEQLYKNILEQRKDLIKVLKPYFSNAGLLTGRISEDEEMIKNLNRVINDKINKVIFSLGLEVPGTKPDSINEAKSNIVIKSQEIKKRMQGRNIAPEISQMLELASRLPPQLANMVEKYICTDHEDLKLKYDSGFYTVFWLFLITFNLLLSESINTKNVDRSLIIELIKSNYQPWKVWPIVESINLLIENINKHIAINLSNTSESSLLVDMTRYLFEPLQDMKKVKSVLNDKKIDKKKKESLKISLLNNVLYKMLKSLVFIQCEGLFTVVNIDFPETGEDFIYGIQNWSLSSLHKKETKRIRTDERLRKDGAIYLLKSNSNVLHLNDLVRVLHCRVCSEDHYFFFAGLTKMDFTKSIYCYRGVETPQENICSALTESNIHAITQTLNG